MVSAEIELHLLVVSVRQQLSLSSHAVAISTHCRLCCIRSVLHFPIFSICDNPLSPFSGDSIKVFFHGHFY
jgi:hypothetical protein